MSFHTSWKVERFEGRDFEWWWECTMQSQTSERWKFYLVELFVLIKTHPHPINRVNEDVREEKQNVNNLAIFGQWAIMYNCLVLRLLMCRRLHVCVHCYVIHWFAHYKT